MSSEPCLLTLIASPAVEETLVDWLLEWGDVSGFSSHPISGHGGRTECFSLAEQVTGRRRKVTFQVHAERAHIGALVEGLKRDFSGAGLHYWVQPLIEAGAIG